MTAPSGSGSVTFVPPPNEQAYYDGLFAVADVKREGALGGPEAVQFFSLSKLPIDILKHIWTIADQPKTNSLDRRKFAIAVRLIQLMQNGQKGQGSNLQAPPGVTLRPPMFEGVSGVSVPLPQQQQQPPPSQRSPPRAPTPQQTQAPPMAPGSRPPSAMSGSLPPMSMALTPQDPYILTPTEQARYEDIFPQYAKPDGFVYGKEAVELFSKSGVAQNQLATIWSMVDHPVDNRLDKLEFAIAMHMIVCISKKNLPVPPTLPMSLKQLKSQQQPGSPPMGPASTPSLPSPPPMASGGYNAPPRSMTPVSMQQPSMGAPPSPLQQSMGGPPSPVPQQTMGGPGQQYSMGSPPPMQQQMGGAPPAQQSMVRTPPVQQTMGAPPMMQEPPQQYMAAAPMMQEAPQVAESPVVERTMSHDNGFSSLPGPPPLPQGGMSGGLSISDAFEGLDGAATTDVNSYVMSAPPVQSTASFDGTSNSMPPPSENQVQMPPPAMEQPVVTQSKPPEPPKTTAQLAASYDMSTSNDELEKLKNMLQKLQAENISLKAQLGTMSDEEHDVQRELSATVQEIGKLSNELTTVRAQVLASKSRLLEATAELKAVEEKKGVMTDLIGEASATKQAIDEATDGIEKTIETVHTQPTVARPPAAAPAGGGFEADLFGFDAPLPGSGPVPLNEPPRESANPGPALSVKNDEAAVANDEMNHVAHHNNDHAETAVNHTSADYHAPPFKGMNNGTGQENGPSYGAFDGGGLEGAGLMGGSAQPSYALSTASTEALQGLNAAGTYETSTAVPSPEEISDLKSKMREADNVAGDAEESRRQLMAQMDEMRRLADEAERKARAHAKDSEGKKKGLLGRGKKKDAKEAEKLAQDARTKKEAFLQAQSQVNDATALATATKREAEKLRREAEDAEMSAAAAASMESAYPKTNGYPSGTNPSYGGSEPTPAPEPAAGTYGNSFGDGMGQEAAYNPSVMSGGGFSIPLPEGNIDYDNPFSM